MVDAADCEVCRGNYSMEEAFGGLWLCEEHRAELDRMQAEAYLRAVIPGAVQAAHPRDLAPSVARWTGDDGVGLFLHGPVGCGKSHAAAALTKRWFMQRARAMQSRRVVWLNVPTAMLHTLSELARGSAGKPSALWDAATTAELLVLDDIGFEQPKEWVRTKLYGLVEHRMHHRLPMIVTSNLDLGALAGRLDSPQIASRLSQCCAQVSFEGMPDRRPGLGPVLE